MMAGTAPLMTKGPLGKGILRRGICHRERNRQIPRLGILFVGQLSHALGNEFRILTEFDFPQAPFFDAGLFFLYPVLFRYKENISSPSSLLWGRANLGAPDRWACVAGGDIHWTSEIIYNLCIHKLYSLVLYVYEAWLPQGNIAIAFSIVLWFTALAVKKAVKIKNQGNYLEVN